MLRIKNFRKFKKKKKKLEPDRKVPRIQNPVKSSKK
jgi:hypothetical protein